MKKILYIILMVLCGGLGQVLVSCGDLLDQKSDRVIYSDKEHLNNASDTLYSVIGIMNKIQALADRTVLLGELRGDLVDVRSNTAADLREISNFNVSTNNQYNSPRCEWKCIYSSTMLPDDSCRPRDSSLPSIRRLGRRRDVNHCCGLYHSWGAPHLRKVRCR